MPRNPEQDVFELWHQQPSEEVPMTISEVQGKARALEMQVWLRNGVEYMVVLILVAVHGPLALAAPNAVEGAGRALIVAAALFVGWQLHRRGTTERMPSSLGAMTCIDFYRAQLVRQRDLFRDAWTWYLVPFIPGAVLVLAGSRLAGARASLIGGAVAFLLVVFGGVAIAHRKAMRDVEAKLDEL